MPTDSATTRLLVWDERDIGAALADVLVVPPNRSPEVDLEAVYLWLAARCADDELPDACLFTTIEPGTEVESAARITDIRNKGFGVVVRPARGDGGGPNGRNRSGGGGAAELTGSLRAYVDRAVGDGRLTEVLVASHDADGLTGRLEELARAGVTVTVLGFRERAGFAAENPRLGFVDLEEVASAFAFPLPRTNLYDLPDEGLALPPLRRPAPGGSQVVPPAAVTVAPSPGSTGAAGSATPAWSTPPGPTGPGTAGAPSGVGISATYLDRSTIERIPAEPLGQGHGVAAPTPRAADAASPVAAPPTTSVDEDRPGGAGAAPSRPTGVGLFGRRSPSGGDQGEEPPPPPPPPPAPASIGALDDLLAGVQASPLTPPAARPGRVSPPAHDADDED